MVSITPYYLGQRQARKTPEVVDAKIAHLVGTHSSEGCLFFCGFFGISHCSIILGVGKKRKFKTLGGPALADDLNLKSIFSDFEAASDKVSFLVDSAKKNRRFSFFDYLIVSNYCVLKFDSAKLPFAEDLEVDALLRQRIPFPHAFRSYLRTVMEARVFYKSISARKEQVEHTVLARLADGGLGAFLERMMRYLALSYSRISHSGLRYPSVKISVP